MDHIENYNDKIHKKSRIAYLFECLFEYLICLIVADSFLAFLLDYINMSEALIGVVSSIGALSCVIGLVAAAIVRKIKDKKRFAVIFHTASNAFFMALYFVPLLPDVGNYRPILAVVCIVAAYFGNNLVTSIIFTLSNSYVDPHKRASFSANKEIVSLIAGMVITISFGYIMGCFTDAGNSKAWFIFAAVSALIFSICDLICLLLIKNRLTSDTPEKKISRSDVIKNTLGNKPYIYTIISACLYKVGIYTTVGFIGSYKNFLYSIATVQLINSAAIIARMLLTRVFGKISDKVSFAVALRYGYMIALAGFLINIFTCPDTRWFIIIYALLYNVSQGFTSQNLLNVTYSYVDSEYMFQAQAISGSIAGACGFGASIVSGRIIDAIQQNGNTFLGLNVYGQQVLSAISCVILLAAIIFNITVLEKQKRIS